MVAINCRLSTIPSRPINKSDHSLRSRSLSMPETVDDSARLLYESPGEKMNDPNRTIFDIKKTIISQVDAMAPALINLAKSLYDHPETAYEERNACRWLSEFLRKEGFSVETAIGGVETAFSANPPNQTATTPSIAFLAEYDALPKIGHGCGHNLIAAASIGAFIALNRAWPDRPGAVQLIGTPAEEGGGGKARLADAGVFEGVDFSLMFHPGNANRMGSNSLGRIKAKVEFFGQTAHAAAAPEKGINALDAMVGAYNNISFLRQQIPAIGRIHGVITSGGDAPNIIPDYTAGLFYIRSLKRDYLNVLFKRFEACCQGAAQATGCSVTITVLPPSLEPMKRNPVMERVWQDNMVSMGLTPCLTDGPTGSTDLGNISQIMPVIQPYLALVSEDISAHTVEFAEATQSAVGRSVLINAAKLLAMTAGDYLASEKTRKATARAFSESQ
jgi:amidohydrolase